MRKERDAMTGMTSPPMSTLMCCIPPCHPLTGRKAQFTGSIEAPLFLHDLPLKNHWFSPSRVSGCVASHTSIGGTPDRAPLLTVSADI